MKRTTARKFYMLLPKATPEDHTRFGTVIFFDNLKHVGIVDTESSFYHAQVSKGTNLSPLNSFWKRRIYGYRGLSRDAGAPVTPPNPARRICVAQSSRGRHWWAEAPRAPRNARPGGAPPIVMCRLDYEQPREQSTQR